MSAQLNSNSVGYAPNYSDRNAVETRASEVTREMERLTHQCEVLNKNLDEMESKLHTILTVPATADGNSQAVPEPVRVPLAQSIYDRAQHLAKLNERLSSIINRIEV